MNTKRLAALGVLSAFALVIFVLELRLPTLIPIPGIKPGLSNIIILIVLFAYDRRAAAEVMLVKLILGGIFAGSMLRFLYSLAGSVLCFVTAALLRSVVSERLVWFLSALAACAHNLGQLLLAVFVMGTRSILWYAPVLILSGIVTGLFTGFCARFTLPLLRRFAGAPPAANPKPARRQK